MVVNEFIVLVLMIFDDGDMVVFILQVVGGFDVYCWFIDELLSVDEVFNVIFGFFQGGVVIFVGIVCNNNNGYEVIKLYYEVYLVMVYCMLMDIIEECE